jgi:hypothetical protein
MSILKFMGSHERISRSSLIRAILKRTDEEMYETASGVIDLLIHNCELRELGSPDDKVLTLINHEEEDPIDFPDPYVISR